MFAVGDILVSDEVLSAPFTCNVGACKGACCVQGDSGAPLEAEERAVLDALVPEVWDDLRPEARAEIEAHGAWEATKDGYATRCVDDAACVFVTYNGPIATCAIQKAYHEGRVDVPKPMSCHLYPLRAASYGSVGILNYEAIDICAPGRTHGQAMGVQLIDFLREPLERKYGAAWVEAFREAWLERRSELGYDDPDAADTSSPTADMR